MFIIRQQTLEEENANIPTFVKPLFAAEQVELKEVAIIERPSPETTNIVFKCDNPTGSSFLFELGVDQFRKLAAQVEAAERRFLILRSKRN